MCDFKASKQSTSSNEIDFLKIAWRSSLVTSKWTSYVFSQHFREPFFQFFWGGRPLGVYQYIGMPVQKHSGIPIYCYASTLIAWYTCGIPAYCIRQHAVHRYTGARVHQYPGMSAFQHTGIQRHAGTPVHRYTGTPTPWYVGIPARWYMYTGTQYTATPVHLYTKK